MKKDWFFKTTSFFTVVRDRIFISSLSFTNSLAELCENIDADWSKIQPILKQDKRIGKYAYLNPGLGILSGKEDDISIDEKFASKAQQKYLYATNPKAAEKLGSKMTTKDYKNLPEKVKEAIIAKLKESK